MILDIQIPYHLYIKYETVDSPGAVSAVRPLNEQSSGVRILRHDLGVLRLGPEHLFQSDAGVHVGAVLPTPHPLTDRHPLEKQRLGVQANLGADRLHLQRHGPRDRRYVSALLEACAGSHKARNPP